MLGVACGKVGGKLRSVLFPVSSTGIIKLTLVTPEAEAFLKRKDSELGNHYPQVAMSGGIKSPVWGGIKRCKCMVKF